MKKQDFLKLWDKLTESVENLTRVADTNRRLLAGISKLLLEKEVVSHDDIKKLENDISSILGQKYPKKSKKKTNKETKIST